MSARPTFDSLRFARAGEELAGEVPLAEFSRLRDMLVTDEGVARYRIRGGVAVGRPVLKLAVDATVILRCQLCLESCRHEMRVDQVFPVARDESQLELWERDDPLLDALVADPEMDVLTLVEDEILLSLPVVPRHAEGECGQVGF